MPKEYLIRSVSGVRRAIDFFKVKKTRVDMLVFEHLDDTQGSCSRHNSKIGPRSLPPGGHTLHKNSFHE